MATTPVSGPSATTTSATKSADSSFQASSMLQNGKFTLDPQNEEVAKSYSGLMGSFGKASADAISGRIEAKMTDWIKAHPTADKAAFQSELRGQLQRECTQTNQIKNYLQKTLGDIMSKMQEMNSDRFSDS